LFRGKAKETYHHNIFWWLQNRRLPIQLEEQNQFRPLFHPEFGTLYTAYSFAPERQQTKPLSCRLMIRQGDE
jgi:hypothetical protein